MKTKEQFKISVIDIPQSHGVDGRAAIGEATSTLYDLHEDAVEAIEKLPLGIYVVRKHYVNYED